MDDDDIDTENLKDLAENSCGESNNQQETSAKDSDSDVGKEKEASTDCEMEGGADNAEKNQISLDDVKIVNYDKDLEPVRYAKDGENCSDSSENFQFVSSENDSKEKEKEDANLEEGETFNEDDHGDVEEDVDGDLAPSDQFDVFIHSETKNGPEEIPEFVQSNKTSQILVTKVKNHKISPKTQLVKKGRRSRKDVRRWHCLLCGCTGKSYMNFLNHAVKHYAKKLILFWGEKSFNSPCSICLEVLFEGKDADLSEDEKRLKVCHHLALEHEKLYDLTCVSLRNTLMSLEDQDQSFLINERDAKQIPTKMSVTKSRPDTKKQKIVTKNSSQTRSTLEEKDITQIKRLNNFGTNVELANEQETTVAYSKPGPKSKKMKAMQANQEVSKSRLTQYKPGPKSKKMKSLDADQTLQEVQETSLIQALHEEDQSLSDKPETSLIQYRPGPKSSKMKYANQTSEDVPQASLPKYKPGPKSKKIKATNSSQTSQTAQELYETECELQTAKIETPQETYSDEHEETALEQNATMQFEADHLEVETEDLDLGESKCETELEENSNVARKNSAEMQDRKVETHFNQIPEVVCFRQAPKGNKTYSRKQPHIMQGEIEAQFEPAKIEKLTPSVSIIRQQIQVTVGENSTEFKPPPAKIPKQESSQRIQTEKTFQVKTQESSQRTKADISFKPNFAAKNPFDECLRYFSRLNNECKKCRTKQSSDPSGFMTHLATCHHADELAEAIDGNRCGVCRQEVAEWPRVKTYGLVHLANRHPHLLFQCLPDTGAKLLQKFAKRSPKTMTSRRRSKPEKKEDANAGIKKEEPDFVDVDDVGPDRLQCPLCEKTFKNIPDLRLHLCLTHYKDKLKERYKLDQLPDRKCPICRKLIGSESVSAERNSNVMTNHLGIKHKGLEKVLPLDVKKYLRGLGNSSGVCPLCNFPNDLKTPCKLKVHLCAVHFTEDILDAVGASADYRTCPVCHKTFGTDHDKPTNWKKNMAKHLGMPHGYLVKVLPDDIKEKLKL